MLECAVCECDREATERGDPFCGYCGRRAGSPAFSDAAGELPLNLPCRLPGKPGDGKPLLTLTLKPRAATPGVVDSARFTDAAGKLLLTRVELCCQENCFELLPKAKIEGGSVTLYLPPDLEASGLPCLGVLHFHFDLRKPAKRKAFIYSLVLQPAEMYRLNSADSRFEDLAAPAAGSDPYAVWQFEESFELLDIVLSPKLHPNWTAVPAFTSARISSRDGTRKMDAGTIVQASGKSAIVQLEPAAIRALLAPSRDGSLLLSVHAPGIEEVAVFDIQILARRTPNLQLEPPVVFEIEFKAHDKGWLTKGCDGLKRILFFEEVQRWQPQFEVAIEPSEELDKAAVFTARIEGGYVTINARFKPEWLREECEERVNGTAKLLLRNSNNSRQRGASVTLDTVRPLAHVTIVLTREWRDSVPVLAIDFGTSNTCAAVIQSNNELTSKEVVFYGEHEGNCPTLLFYKLKRDDAGNESVSSVVFGKTALSESRLNHSTCFRKGFKTDLQRLNPQPILIGETLTKSALELTTDFLTPFLRQAVLSPDIDGRPIEQLVFTFPVAAGPHYVEVLGDAIRKAAENLKLPIGKSRIVKSCDEASAGGIWWFCQRKEAFKNRQKVSLLVFDYGGGTTDLSVLEFRRIAGVWQVTIKGISGISPCGGEDLTWRLAREFMVCAKNDSQAGDPMRPNPARKPLRPIQPDSMLGMKLKEFAELEGREKWQKQHTMSLLEVIEDRKIAAVGGQELDILPKPVFLDLLENNESAFVPGAVDYRGDRYNLEDSCEPGTGSLAMCRFSEFKQQQSEFVAAKDDGMLQGHVWLFKVQDKLLAEPVMAIQVAKNLIEHIYDGGQVDYLLPIGQASKTRAVQAMIRQRLEGKYGEIAEEGIKKAKSCVALGACDFQMQRRDWDFRRTLLKRIIYRDGMDHRQLMRSDAELNAIVTLEDPDLLRRPGDNLIVLVDSTYAAKGIDGLRRPLTRVGSPGFASVEPDVKINVVVAVPSDAKSYAKLPPAVCALTDELDRGETSNRWYFLAWPGDDVGQAWKYWYYV